MWNIYCDDDRTGMNFDRSGFQEMMGDIRGNLVDCIVVKNLSRLNRYDTEMQKYLEKEFEQRGREVRVIAIGDNYDSLYKEPDIADRFRLLINREYSEQQHWNVSIGMHSMQKKLTDDKPTQVAKDQWIRCEGTHEAIISKEQWKIAQSMMKTIKRDRTKEDEVTIFKGILKCGDCRHAMRKKWDAYTQLKTGKTAKYLYYNCATYRDYSQHKKLLGENAPKCTSHYVSDKLLRKIVINDMNQIIRQVENLQELAKKYQKAPNQRLPLVLQEIENKEKRILQYKERLSCARTLLYDGTIRKEEYESDKTTMQADISSLEHEIDLLQRNISKVSDVLANPWIQRLLENGEITELDRVTVVEFVDKIYVYEDKRIEIVYKFSGEFDGLFAKSV